MSKEKRLGRGLEALLGKMPDPYADEAVPAAAREIAPTAGPMQVSVYEVDSNPFQPRRDFEEPELAQLAEKARTGKLSIDEMSGGCFTITNLGGIGGTHFTPIVNHPEVAIMGMSRSAMEPVWNGTSFEPRLMLPLSLSYDHRVIDGADAARFLRFVAEGLEQPLTMVL